MLNDSTRKTPALIVFMTENLRTDPKLFEKNFPETKSADKNVMFHWDKNMHQGREFLFFNICLNAASKLSKKLHCSGFYFSNLNTSQSQTNKKYAPNTWTV